MQLRNLSLSVQAILCGVIGGMSVTIAPMALAQTTTVLNSANEEVPSTTLDPIIITASSGGVTPSVNQQTIEKGNIIDMKDVLKDQPSLSVSGGNGVAQQLYIRNFGENELTFSVDNVSPNAQLFHHQSRFMFDPALLKSMNIEKGTGQASSGIGVTAGAVRMTTVDANDMLRKGQNVGAMIGGGYSSNKGYRGVGAVYGRSDDKRFDGILMGNYIQYENYKDGDGHEVPNTKMNQEAYMAKFGWNINADNRLEISQRREQTSGDLGFRPNLIGDYGVRQPPSPRNPNPQPQPTLDTTITQDTTNLVYQGYDVAGHEGLDINANAYYSQSTDQRKQVAHISPRFPQKFDIGMNTKGANASVSIPVMNHHRFETGLNYRQSETNTAIFTSGSGKEHKTDTGIFAQMDWDFNPVRVITGVRYDHYDITNNDDKNIKGDMVSPSISAKWQVNDNFAINGSWSQAMQSPRIYESMILSLPWATKHDFADNLKPGKAQTTEVGMEWQGDNGFMADANIFEQNIKGYITSKETTQDNHGDLKNRGYEVNVGYRKDGIKAFLGMSHSDPKLDGKYYGYALDVMPTGTKYNASVAYQFDQPRLEIGVKNHYVNDFSYQEDDGKGNLVPQDLDSYWVTDVFANWQPLATDRLSVNAGINNITNQKYYNQSNFRTTRFGNEELNPEKGREFRIGMNYKF